MIQLNFSLEGSLVVVFSNLKLGNLSTFISFILAKDCNFISFHNCSFKIWLSKNCVYKYPEKTEKLTSKTGSIV